MFNSRNGTIECKVNASKHLLEMGKLTVIAADGSQSTYELSESASMVIACLLMHIESMSDRLEVLTTDDPEGLLLPGQKDLEIAQRELSKVRAERDHFACQAAAAEASLQRYTDMVGRVKELLRFAIDPDKPLTTLEHLASKVARLFAEKRGK